MYITEFLEYLIWPAFILLSWILTRYALSVYDRRFPEKEEHVSE